MDLSIVIPAYKEDENLRQQLPKIVEVCSSLLITCEILVVDTMTPMDGSPEVCCSLAHVIYLPREGSNDYGDAIRTGIRHSNGERILIMDADGSHDPLFIAQAWKYKDTADLMIASRYIKGGKTENHFWLVFMSKILNMTYRLVLGIPCTDVSNSFKLYRGDWLRNLQLVCNHFDVVEEILIKILLQHSKMRILEIPSVFYQRDKGVTKRNLLSFIFSYLKTLKKLRAFKQQELLKISHEEVVCR